MSKERIDGKKSARMIKKPTPTQRVLALERNLELFYNAGARESFDSYLGKARKIVPILERLGHDHAAHYLALVVKEYE